MNPYTAVIAAQHLADLQREAEAARLAGLVRRSVEGPGDRPAGLNRLAARSARWLSGALAGLASRIDPVDGGAAAREHRKARPLAA